MQATAGRFFILHDPQAQMWKLSRQSALGEGVVFLERRNIVLSQMEIADGILDAFDLNTDMGYDELKQMPDKAQQGIYIIWRGDWAQYVGHSCDIKERLGGHSVFREGKHLFTTVLISDMSLALRVERTLIAALAPVKNKKGV